MEAAGAVLQRYGPEPAHSNQQTSAQSEVGPTAAATNWPLVFQLLLRPRANWPDGQNDGRQKHFMGPKAENTLTRWCSLHTNSRMLALAGDSLRGTTFTVKTVSGLRIDL